MSEEAGLTETDVGTADKDGLEDDPRSVLSDITLVLLAHQGNSPRVAKWLERLARDATLADVNVIVWSTFETSDDTEEAEDREQPDPEQLDMGPTEPSNLQRVRMVEGKGGESPQDVLALLGEVTTKYFVITPVAKLRSKTLSSLKKKTRTALRLMSKFETTGHRPLLLATHTCPRPVLISYLNVTMGSERTDDVGTNDYLGFLAIQTAVGSVESADPEPDGMRVFARLNFGGLNLEDPPPWRFVLSLVSSSGTVLESQPTALKTRVSMYGDTRWEYATASIPLTVATTGEYRMVVSLATDTPRLRGRRGLRPTVGVLLTARTVQLDAHAQRKALPVKYLIHTTGDARTTRVTLQRGGAVRSDTRWAKVLLKKDLRTIVRPGASRQMRLLRLARLVSSAFMHRRSIWLVGERIGTAQDNGFHLFKYLRSQHPERKVYYVMDKSSSQFDRVKDLGNVIEHSSLRHRFLMLHAAVLADAYSISYLIPKQWNRDKYARHLAWRIGALRIYLKHGVHMSPNAVKRGTTGYDMILTVSSGETAALAEATGYREQLTEVGLPRYDTLRPTEATRVILFMSTWRRYLVPKVFGGENKDQTPYEGSAYDTFMSNFLRSKRLKEILESHNYRLVFLPHYNLATHFEDFTTGTERVSIADTDSSTFQDLIRQCDAFITDHSSVSFDIAYLGTPMIYARFDQEEFDRRHVAPSWFNHERDGFGPVTYTLSDTLDELERLLERGCEPDDFYTQRVESTFASRDQDNCRRTVQAIDELLAKGKR